MLILVYVHVQRQRAMKLQRETIVYVRLFRTLELFRFSADARVADEDAAAGEAGGDDAADEARTAGRREGEGVGEGAGGGGGGGDEGGAARGGSEEVEEEGADGPTAPPRDVEPQTAGAGPVGQCNPSPTETDGADALPVPAPASRPDRPVRSLVPTFIPDAVPVPGSSSRASGDAAPLSSPLSYDGIQVVVVSGGPGSGRPRWPLI